MDLSGAQRAAIFLLGIGEQGAAAVMKHMAPKEVQRIGEAMANLSDVPSEQVVSVVQDFTHSVNNVSPIGVGAPAFTRRVMIQALGENRARRVLSSMMPENGSKGVEALKWMDARSVATLIKNEHPQIIAIILASLEGDHAAGVLALLSESTRTDIVMRVAKLQMIDPSALKELDEVLESQLGKSQKLPPTAVDGLSTAAAILNNLDSPIESSVLEEMGKLDAGVTEKVNELMFVFENLMDLDDRGMQRLIREISVDSLVIALRGVDQELQERFFKNMSTRAADMLKEDMEAKGPVKVSDVEEAQKDILSIATRLASEGELFLGKGDGDFV